MKNLVMKVAYDGTCFFGWQKTKNGPTVESELERVLRQVLQEPIELQAASRTDRGVHAEAQCVNFFTEKNRPLNEVLKSINSLLPSTIRILSLKAAPLDFHPTLHALKKEYVYTICNSDYQLPQNRHFSWHIPYPLDLQKIEKAFPYFLEKRDYSSFCNMRKNLNYKDKNRSLESLTFTQSFPGSLRFSLVGEKFLYKMARNIVGTLVYIGLGKITFSDLPQIFAAQSRPLAGITAPAHGLTLKTIYYSRHQDFT